MKTEQYQQKIKALESEISAIKARNKRVEMDKQWETSFTRRIAIIVLTYGVVVIFMSIIGIDKPFYNALIPVIGFLLSTLSVGLIKDIWVKKHKK